MRNIRQFWLSVVFLLGVSVLCGISGAADINAKIGDRVDLTGTTVGTDTIYLFVTGPGLAPDGVRLDNMRMAVVSGEPSTFTVVDVSNDRWAYSWNTARQGFSLKEGIYTVYATKQPVSKADINSATYDTVDVSLTYSGAPYQSGGTVTITTSPVPAEVYIDSFLMGLTPQNLTLPQGTLTLSLVSGGYQTINESISVQSGSSIVINRTIGPSVATDYCAGDFRNCYHNIDDSPGHCDQCSRDHPGARTGDRASLGDYRHIRCSPKDQMNGW